MRSLVALLLAGALVLPAAATEWQVTTASANSAHPTWCGNNIMFHSDRDGVFQIWGVGEQTGYAAWRVTNQPWLSYTEPHWHCAGHWVSFCETPASGPDSVAVVFDMALPATPLTVTEGNGNDRSPHYTPDGIALHSDRNGHDDIYVINSGGEAQGLTRLTTSVAQDRCPAISPDGEWIAFASDRSGSFDIWVMSAAGEADSLRQLTSGPADDLEPAWSPGGTHVAFARGGAGIVAVDVASRTEFAVTSSAGDASPAWSPEGDLLAFTRPGAYEQIWCTDNAPPGTAANAATWGSIKARYR